MELCKVAPRESGHDATEEARQSAMSIYLGLAPPWPWRPSLRTSSRSADWPRYRNNRSCCARAMVVGRARAVEFVPRTRRHQPTKPRLRPTRVRRRTPRLALLRHLGLHERKADSQRACRRLRSDAKINGLKGDAFKAAVNDCVGAQRLKVAARLQCRQQGKAQGWPADPQGVCQEMRRAGKAVSRRPPAIAPAAVSRG